MKKKPEKITKEFAKELVDKAKNSTSFQSILEKAKVEFSGLKVTK